MHAVFYINKSTHKGEKDSLTRERIHRLKVAGVRWSFMSNQKPRFAQSGVLVMRLRIFTSQA
jgi:hypothetical protein